MRAKKSTTRPSTKFQGLATASSPCQPVVQLRDGGGELVGHHVFVHHEVGAVEEGADGCAEEQGAEHAVQDEKPAIGVLAQEVAEFALELIADGLEHEAEEDEHPHPVGTAELVL